MNCDENSRKDRKNNFFLRYSETSFLLIFSLAIGVGSGFGAIVFRWLIESFIKLFFERSFNILYFMGSFYVIIISAIGGLIVGPLIYFLRERQKVMVFLR